MRPMPGLGPSSEEVRHDIRRRRRVRPAQPTTFVAGDDKDAARSRVQEGRTQRDVSCVVTDKVVARDDHEPCP